MFKRINARLAKELLPSGLVWHDCAPYNVVRVKGRNGMYAQVDTDDTDCPWPRVMDWDSRNRGYMYFLRLEDWHMLQRLTIQK